jgi:ribosomal protein L37AE/L43A
MNHYDYCPECHSECRQQEIASRIVKCTECGHQEFPFPFWYVSETDQRLGAYSNKARALLEQRQ